jgi:shikimate kinase
MSTFYIDLLSIFFLFLTSITCVFAIFGRFGLYWLLPFLASSVLALVRIFKLFDPQSSFTVLEGREFYLAMLTPTGILILFLSSLFLRYGINRRGDEKQHIRISSYRLPAEHSDPLTVFEAVMRSAQPVPERVDTHIFYISGIKHSGKSTLSKLASRQLNIQSFDLDDLIIEMFENTPLEETSIRELYGMFGKNRFMQLEYAALSTFLAFCESSKIPGIDEFLLISLGGGACDNERLMALIRKTGHLIYLSLPEPLLYSRIAKSGIPPFLDADNPRKSFHALYAYRDGIYREHADTIIELTVNAPPQQNAQQLCKLIYNLAGDTHGSKHIRPDGHDDHIR